MPQSDKSDFESTSGRSDLEGKTFECGTDENRLNILHQAFDYRGDVTLLMKDGSEIEGYVHNVNANANRVTLFAKVSKRESENQEVVLDHIVKIHFSGPDTAFGKSWDDWMAKSAAQREKEASLLRDKSIERGEL
jgi:transcriptional antiterminator Rof (Rho-off)